jgi:hypothetical protein
MLITRLMELTLVRVSIIKGAGKPEVVSRLEGFGRGAIALAASYSRCNITIGRALITISGSNEKRLVFSQDLLILYSLRDTIRALQRISRNINLLIE